MSKRAGEFITLDELLAEVGVDAARWFFASRARDDRHRLRHRAGQEAVEREPRLLRPVRARPDRVDPAQGRRGRAGAGDRRRRARSRARPRRRWPGRSPASRRSSRTPSRPRRPRASPPTPPSSRRRSTASTATRGSSTPDEPERSAARLALAERRADHARQRARRCSGSPRPTRCSAATASARAAAGQARRAGDLGGRRRVVRGDEDPARRAAGAGRTWPTPPAAFERGRWRPSRTRSASASVSQAVSMTTAQAPSGPSITASRSPPQPAAAVVAAAAGDAASRSQIASWNSPNVSWSGTVQPAPSRSRGRPGGSRRPAPRRRRTSRGGGSARSTRASSS